ncbi:hypothetical protein BGZ82_003793 [Podila clonocystis]|nr:hypothetical protein BGZ82_003793 [Podila clonocystis]
MSIASQPLYVFALHRRISYQVKYIARNDGSSPTMSIASLFASLHYTDGSHSQSDHTQAMPVPSYGVWVGQPTRYDFETRKEDRRSPHIHLFFNDDPPSTREYKAAINIKSIGAESRLVCWYNDNFTHYITSHLEKLDLGFYELPIYDEVEGLDYIRGTPLLNIETGEILPHDLPGKNNDILDKMLPFLNSVLSRKPRYTCSARRSGLEFMMST